MAIALYADLIIFLILYKVSKKFNIQKLYKASKIMLKEGLITLIMFNAFNIAFSAGIHWKYNKSQGPTSIYSNLLMYGTLFVIITAVICLQVLGQSQYGEFKNKFKKNCVCRSYIAVSILYRMVLGLYIALQNDYIQSTLLILLASIIFIMFNVTNLPFKDTFQNYRCTLIHVTQVIILLCGNYYRSMKANTPMQIKGQINTPALIQVIMILISLVISFSGIIYEIKKFIKLIYKRRNKNFQLKDTNNQTTNQIADQIPIQV